MGTFSSSVMVNCFGWIDRLDCLLCIAKRRCQVMCRRRRRRSSAAEKATTGSETTRKRSKPEGKLRRSSEKIDGHWEHQNRSHAGFDNFISCRFNPSCFASRTGKRYEYTWNKNSRHPSCRNETLHPVVLGDCHRPIRPHLP